MATSAPEVETMSHLTTSFIASEAASGSKSALKELDASLLKTTLSETQRPVPEQGSKEVWSVKACTDHMLSVKWTDDYGWHAPEIVPVSLNSPFTVLQLVVLKLTNASMDLLRSCLR